MQEFAQAARSTSFRLRQPVEARQWVRQNYEKHVWHMCPIFQEDSTYFKKHIWHMFHIQFFKRNRRRQRQPGQVQQVGTSYFKKHILHIWHSSGNNKKRIEDNSSFRITSWLTFFRVCIQIFYCNIRFPNQKRFALVQYDNFSWGILLRNNTAIVVPWEILHVIKTDKQLSAWLMLSTSMSMTWRPLTYLRPFPIDASWKIGHKTCVF